MQSWYPESGLGTTATEEETQMALKGEPGKKKTTKKKAAPKKAAKKPAKKR